MQTLFLDGKKTRLLSKGNGEECRTMASRLAYETAISLLLQTQKIWSEFGQVRAGLGKLGRIRREEFSISCHQFRVPDGCA